MVNAGVSGETSAGALRRIDWLMDQGTVAVLFLETGANDGLRGQDPDTLRANIDAILARARQQDPRAGPDPGRDGGSSQSRRPVHRAVSARSFPPQPAASGAALVPFLLDGVAGVEVLNQSDGIHPTPEGHQRIAELIWGVVLEAVRRAR